MLSTTWHGSRHYLQTRRQPEPSDPVRQDHPPGSPQGVAEAASGFAGQPPDRTGRQLPPARRLRLDREFDYCHSHALFDSNGGRLQTRGKEIRRARLITAQNPTQRRPTRKCAPYEKTRKIRSLLKYCLSFPKLTITPGGIRTPNLRFRRPLLYPVELQAQVIHIFSFSSISFSFIFSIYARLRLFYTTV
jgi:hypothetical protein